MQQLIEAWVMTYISKGIFKTLGTSQKTGPEESLPQDWPTALHVKV